MALGDVGLFQPSKEAFVSPGAYEQYLEAEALRSASYLSQMDMFYEQLGEEKRQFDLGFGLAEDKFEENKTQWDESLSLQKEAMTEAQRQFNETLEWEKESWGDEFEQSKFQFEEVMEMNWAKFEETQRQFDELQDAQQGALDEQLQLQRDALEQGQTQFDEMMELRWAGQDLEEEKFDYSKILMEESAAGEGQTGTKNYGQAVADYSGEMDAYTKQLESLQNVLKSYQGESLPSYYPATQETTAESEVLWDEYYGETEEAEFGA